GGQGRVFLFGGDLQPALAVTLGHGMVERMGEGLGSPVEGQEDASRCCVLLQTGQSSRFGQARRHWRRQEWFTAPLEVCSGFSAPWERRCWFLPPGWASACLKRRWSCPSCSPTSRTP